MIENEGDWRRAIEQTWVVRYPRQRLATFGTTNISYYVVTKPIYEEQDASKQEGVVRTGRVMAERPAVVTPTYAMNLKGFSPEAYEYISDVARQSGANSPGILYQYKNEAENVDIVGGTPSEIAHRISDDLDRRKENMSVVLVGVDELWDVSLMKFIYELTDQSVQTNVDDLHGRGLLAVEDGVPREARHRIERLLDRAAKGQVEPSTVHQELKRWGLFEEYQDRFLALFRGR